MSAEGAMDDRRSWSGLRSRSSIAVKVRANNLGVQFRQGYYAPQ